MKEKEYKILNKYQNSRPKYYRCVLRNCLQCQNEFYPTVYSIKKGYGRFCSKICSNKFNLTGAKNHNFGKPVPESVREKIRQSLMGRKYPDRQGANCYLWKGGISTENEKARQLPRYDYWRKKVFERDDYTCQWCGQRGGKLNADHIYNFAIFEELRYELSNGRTLCVLCHKKTGNYGRKDANVNLYFIPTIIKMILHS